VMATASSSAPRVELVVFEGCPNARAARELIDQVSASLALEPQVDVVVVPDAETAERARFLGSPRQRVGGAEPPSRRAFPARRRAESTVATSSRAQRTGRTTRSRAASMRPRRAW